jgi:hypothetical protein
MTTLVLEASVGRATHLAGVIIVARGYKVARGQVTLSQERGVIPERGERTLRRLRPIVHALRILRRAYKDRVIGMSLRGESQYRC